LVSCYRRRCTKNPFPSPQQARCALTHPTAALIACEHKLTAMLKSERQYAWSGLQLPRTVVVVAMQLVLVPGWLLVNILLECANILWVWAFPARAMYAGSTLSQSSMPCRRLRPVLEIRDQWQPMQQRPPPLQASCSEAPHQSGGEKPAEDDDKKKHHHQQTHHPPQQPGGQQQEQEQEQDQPQQQNRPCQQQREPERQHPQQDEGSLQQQQQQGQQQQQPPQTHQSSSEGLPSEDFATSSIRKVLDESGLLCTSMHVDEREQVKMHGPEIAEPRKATSDSAPLEEARLAVAVGLVAPPRDGVATGVASDDVEERIAASNSAESIVGGESEAPEPVDDGASPVAVMSLRLLTACGANTDDMRSSLDSVAPQVRRRCPGVRVSVPRETLSTLSVAVLGESAAVTEACRILQEGASSSDAIILQETHVEYFFALHFTMREMCDLPHDEEIADASIEDDWVDVGGGAAVAAVGGADVQRNAMATLLRARLLEVLSGRDGLHLFMDDNPFASWGGDALHVDFIAPLTSDAWRSAAEAALACEAHRAYLSRRWDAIFWCAKRERSFLEDQAAQACSHIRGGARTAPLGGIGVVGLGTTGLEDLAANICAVLRGEEPPGWHRLEWTPDGAGVVPYMTY